MATRYLEGIDVSNNNGYIDWDKVAAAGKRFAFIKSTEGVDFTDAFFLANWFWAKGHGIVPGAYHFCRPSRNSAADEADFFVATMGGPTFEKGEFIALDLEDEHVPVGVSLLDWVLDWMQRVTEGCEVKPVLYSSPAYLQEHGCLGEAALADYGLWLASWRATLPAPPPPWPVIAFWQYDAHGSVPGVQGECDLDRFNGTLAQMKRYGAP